MVRPTGSKYNVNIGYYKQSLFWGINFAPNIPEMNRYYSRFGKGSRLTFRAGFDTQLYSHPGSRALGPQSVATEYAYDAKGPYKNTFKISTPAVDHFGALAYILGDCVTTNPAPDVYQHDINYQHIRQHMSIAAAIIDDEGTILTKRYLLSDSTLTTVKYSWDIENPSLKCDVEGIYNLPINLTENVNLNAHNAVTKLPQPYVDVQFTIDAYLGTVQLTTISGYFKVINQTWLEGRQLDNIPAAQEILLGDFKVESEIRFYFKGETPIEFNDQIRLFQENQLLGTHWAIRFVFRDVTGIYESTVDLDYCQIMDFVESEPFKGQRTFTLKFSAPEISAVIKDKQPHQITTSYGVETIFYPG